MSHGRMGSKEFVVRLAHPAGKYVSTYHAARPPAAGDVIRTGGRRWMVVEIAASADPRGGPTVVVVPAREDEIR